MTSKTPGLRLTSEPHDEYEALADLFLETPGPSDGEPTMPGAGRPIARGEGEAVAVASSRVPEPIETSDALPPASQTEPGVRSRALPRVQGIVLGHLPVMGSAWVREHARSVASASGETVALLRISGGHAALDLFGQERVVRDVEPTSDLTKGVERVRPLVGAWLVQTDAVSEAALALTEGVDEVALLTGADEAAVVAAYRTVKTLVAKATSTMPLRVIVAGADLATSREALQRIHDAVRSFLKIDVTVERGSEQIGPGPSAAVFRGETKLDLASAVSLIHAGPSSAAAPVPDDAHRWVPQRFDGVPTSPAAPDGGTPDGVMPDGVMPDGGVAEAGVGQTVVEPKPARPTRAPSTNAMPGDPVGDAEVPAATPLSAPASHTISERTTGEPPRSGVGLAGITNAHGLSRPPLPGARVVVEKCPLSARVSLQRDGSGGSHLVAYPTSSRDAERCLADLQAARTWLRGHAEMLTGLTRERIDADAELHLVTPTPAWARGMLDAEVRVHLVVPPSSETVFVPLNDAT